MEYVQIEKDKFNLITECLECLKQVFLMLEKIPMKKAKKLKSNQIKSCLDELISYCKSIN